MRHFGFTQTLVLFRTSPFLSAKKLCTRKAATNRDLEYFFLFICEKCHEFIIMLVDLDKILLLLAFWVI